MNKSIPAQMMIMLGPSFDPSDDLPFHSERFGLIHVGLQVAKCPRTSGSRNGFDE
jgi:hypothetical protein